MIGSTFREDSNKLTTDIISKMSTKIVGTDSCSCEANIKVDFNLICSISNLFLCIYEKVPDLSSKPSILLYPVIVFK